MNIKSRLVALFAYDQVVRKRIQSIQWYDGPLRELLNWAIQHQKQLSFVHALLVQSFFLSLLHLGCMALEPNSQLTAVYMLYIPLTLIYHITLLYLPKFGGEKLCNLNVSGLVVSYLMSTALTLATVKLSFLYPLFIGINNVKAYELSIRNLICNMHSICCIFRKY